MTETDLIIALGVRFDDRVTGRLAAFAPHAKVIHVDIDPAEIGKNRAADVPIVGDVKRVLEKLNQELDETAGNEVAPRTPARAAWCAPHQATGSASIRSIPKSPRPRSSRST